MEPNENASMEFSERELRAIFFTFSSEVLEAITSVAVEGVAAPKNAHALDRASTQLAKLLDRCTHSMEGRLDAALVVSMAAAEMPSELASIWCWWLSVSRALTDDPREVPAVRMAPLFPVLRKSVEVMRRMCCAIKCVLGKRTAVADMQANAPARVLIISMLEPHGGLTNLFKLVHWLSTQQVEGSSLAASECVKASEVAVEFLQAAMATSDAVAFMKTRPFVIEMLFKVCSLSPGCLNAAMGSQRLAAPQISTYVDAIAFSADLLCELHSSSPEAGSLGGLRLATTLLQSASVLVLVQFQHQQANGEKQWPQVHLSFVGTQLRKITELLRGRLSAPQGLPAGLAAEDVARTVPAARQRAALPAQAPRSLLLGDESDAWLAVLGVACRCSWKALQLRHSDASFAGDLEHVHLLSAQLLSLGLAELMLGDILLGHTPSECLCLIEAAMRSHQQAPRALRGHADDQIEAARELSALVPRLALANLTAVDLCNQDSGASSSSSELSSMEGFAAVLSAFCTMRKVSVSLMSRFGSDMDDAVWDELLSGVLLEAIHTQGKASSSLADLRAEEAASNSLASPGTEGAALISSSACCHAAQLIQRRVSALRVASAAMVQLLPPICSGVRGDLDKCLTFMEVEAAAAITADKPGTCRETILIACFFLGEWAGTLAWACSGPWMPGYPECGTGEAGERCDSACRPASGPDPDPDPIVAPGCDSCTSLLAFEINNSLALVIRAVGASRVPPFLGEAGKWLALLLDSGLEPEEDGDRGTALALQLSQDLACGLDAIFELAAAAIEVSLQDGGSPVMHSDDARSDGAARDGLAVEWAAAAVKAACYLVVEVLQCGLLQQLTSGSLLQLRCRATLEAADQARAAATGQKLQTDEVVPPTAPAADPLAHKMLGLVPVLFNRLALSLTRCIRALAASVEEGGILGCSVYGLQSPTEGPSRTSEIEGLRQARCAVDGFVSRSCCRAEVLAIASSKLVVASSALQDLLQRHDLPPDAEPGLAETPPAAAPLTSCRARRRNGFGLASPRRAPEAAMAAGKHDTALTRSYAAVVALLEEALDSCVAAGISLKELGDAAAQLVRLELHTLSRYMDATSSSSWHSVQGRASEPSCEHAREAAAAVDPISLELCGRDWGLLEAHLEGCYLTDDEWEGCCSNVNCGNFMSVRDLDLQLSPCSGGCCCAWYCSEACERQAKPHHVCTSSPRAV